MTLAWINEVRTIRSITTFNSEVGYDGIIGGGHALLRRPSVIGMGGGAIGLVCAPIQDGGGGALPLHAASL